MALGLQSRLPSRILVAAALAATLALGGCATSAVDDLDSATPVGSPFTQALFRNYAYLARSFGDVGSPSSSLFDSDDQTDMSVDDLADAYARKALQAAQGMNVAPEPAPTPDAQAMLARLTQALDAGREKAPDDAARAQADYDCWVMNGRVASQQAASAACRASLNGSLARLEHDVNPPVPPPAAPQADYTVYFEFDSWTLTAEDLQVITNAIDNARAGGQSHITIVGHTDTSGSPGYNQRLSQRRADVVKDVMVQMGARAEAIQVSGVGESDLAVPTADGVREAKNRRTVITLLP